MKEYPVGSVCVIVQSKYHPENVGKECTILTGLHSVEFGRIGVAEVYKIDLQGCYSDEWAFHDSLQLKRFPPDTESWLREKMDDILSLVPNNINVKETV
jgi:hypothetical protein